MRMMFAALLILIGSEASGRAIYFNMYVPQSLQNLGYSSAATWVGDCANCHRTSAGGQVGVPDLNAMFGRDVYAFVANTGSDFPQTTIQMIIQGIEGLDSDNDGATNLQEYRGRTNPNNPLSKPATQGDGGRTDDPNEFFPPGGELSEASTRVVTSEDTYALSGCGANDSLVQPADMGNVRMPFAASSSIAGLWLIPLLLVLFERKRQK